MPSSAVGDADSGAPGRLRSDDLELEPPRRADGGRWAVVSALTALVLLALGLLLMGHRQALRSSPSPRLLVMPFESPSLSAADQALGNGLTEELITELARQYSDRLGVIARTSAMRFERSRKRAREIGRELDVDYLVTGSVRRSGQGVRITAQLVRTDDETNVWSHSYEGPASDVHLEVARQVAGALGLVRPGGPVERGDVPAAAWERYLEGRYLLSVPRMDARLKAIEALREATRLAPRFAAAHAALADAGWSPFGGSNAGVPAAEAAAHRALELDPELAAPHLTLGRIALYQRYDWDAARREIERALALNPGDAQAHHDYATYLAALGRTEECLAAVNRALALDPISPPVVGDMAWFYYMGGRFDEAIQKARHTLELDPEYLWAHTIIQWSALEKGDDAAALYAIRELAARQGRQPPATLAGYWSGLRSIEWPRLPSMFQATAAMRIGEPERALDALEESCRRRAGWLHLFAAVDPQFAPLRSDPRFERLLECVHYPGKTPTTDSP